MGVGPAQALDSPSPSGKSLTSRGTEHSLQSPLLGRLPSGQEVGRSWPSEGVSLAVALLQLPPWVSGFQSSRPCPLGPSLWL